MESRELVDGEVDPLSAAGVANANANAIANTTEGGDGGGEERQTDRQASDERYEHRDRESELVTQLEEAKANEVSAYQAIMSTIRSHALHTLRQPLSSAQQKDSASTSTSVAPKEGTSLREKKKVKKNDLQRLTADCEYLCYWCWLY